MNSTWANWALCEYRWQRRDDQRTTRKCCSGSTFYGDLKRIQSSRRLEREAQRNIELMWLMGRLTPDFKTIANFARTTAKQYAMYAVSSS